MEIPRTRHDLEALIHNQVQESARLEYKASKALSFPKQTGEFAKDVSAMANSDGGTIIYGVEEKGHLPVSIDAGAAHSDITRERLEQLILGNIRPRLNFEIVQISLSPDASAYVIAVQRSDRPHQNTVDKKYYKRFNFSAQPMEDYEINDVRGRGLVSEPEVRIALDAGGYMIYFVVENVSRWPVFDVAFGFPAEMAPWLEKHKAPAITRGLRTMPPGRRLRFLYGAYLGLIDNSNPLPKQFEVSVSYRRQPDSPPKTETLYVDLMDYFGSQIEKTEAERLGEQVEKGLADLTKQVEKLVGSIDKHVGPMSTGSGITISVTALRNLRRLLAGTEELEKVDPHDDFTVVQEVLQIDRALAARIWKFLFFRSSPGHLEDLEGVTPELAAEIRRKLVVRDSGPDTGNE